MADAGFKLAVEGEREFKKAIAEINAQIKANAAELKLLTAQYANTDDGMEKLTANQKALETSLETQGQKVALLREQYEKAAAEFGETDTRVVKLKTELANASAEYVKMSAEVEKNQAAIDASWKAMEDYQDATAKASEILGGLDDVMARNRKEIAELADQYKSLGDKSGDAAKKQENLTAQNKLLADSVESQHKKIDALNEELDAAVRLYGENSEEVREYRDRVNEATRELNSLEDQIKDNDKALEDSEDAGDGLLGTLEEVADQVGIQIPDGLKKMIGGEGSGLVGAGVAAGIIFKTMEQVVKLTKESLDYADEVKRRAQESSLDPETYQMLEYAAGKLGAEMESVDDALKEIGLKAQEAMELTGEYYEKSAQLKAEADAKKQQLLNSYLAEMPQLDYNKSYAEYEKEIEQYEKKYQESLEKINEEYKDSVDDLRSDAEEAMKVFDDIGVNIADSSGNIRPAVDIFLDVVDSLNSTSDSSDRLKKATALMGEEARKLNPLIDAGSDVLKNYMEKAKDLGIVMDNETVDALDKADMKFYDFNKTLEAASRDFIPNVIQGFKDIGTWLTGGTLNKKGGILANLAGVFDDFKVLFGGGYSGKAYANGTYNHPGGYALVGEKGPEIVELPRGSRVYPSGTGPQTGTVNNYSITISAKDVREFNDIVRIAEGQKQSIRMGYNRR